MAEIKVDIIFAYILFAIWSFNFGFFVYVTVLNSLGDQRILFSEKQTNSTVLYCIENVLAFLTWFINFASYTKQGLHVLCNLKYFGLQFKRTLVGEIFKSCSFRQDFMFSTYFLAKANSEGFVKFVFLKQRFLISECNFSLLAKFVEFENLL